MNYLLVYLLCGLLHFSTADVGSTIKKGADIAMASPLVPPVYKAGGAGAIGYNYFKYTFPHFCIN